MFHLASHLRNGASGWLIFVSMTIEVKLNPETHFIPKDILTCTTFHSLCHTAVVIQLLRTKGWVDLRIDQNVISDHRFKNFMDFILYLLSYSRFTVMLQINQIITLQVHGITVDLMDCIGRNTDHQIERVLLQDISIRNMTDT